MKVNNKFYPTATVTPGEKSPMIPTEQEAWLVPESIWSYVSSALPVTQATLFTLIMQYRCTQYLYPRPFP
jgi:hypothetical protein